MLGMILQAIIAIPQIISMVLNIIKTVEQMKERQKEAARQDAIRRLKEAKTIEDAKNAIRDIANQP